MRSLLLGLVLVIAQNAWAHEATHHSRVGFHGMVLFTDGAALYASHLPLYVTPHDYQLIYRIESDNKHRLIEYLQRDKQAPYESNMVTLLPEKFDLNRLINRESLSLKTQFYRGHFERGGTTWSTMEEVHFVEPIYIRQLKFAQQTQLPLKSDWQALPLSSVYSSQKPEKTLYIHKIQSAPSFDALILANGCEGDINNGSDDVPTLSQLAQVFAACEGHQVLYFETQDFAK